MTQNPYAQSESLDPSTPMATRTSVAAILSLVCALICPIPGLSILAVIIGIAALFMIGSSQGRVTGKGIAITGIMLGLVVTVLWGGAIIMFQKAAQFMGQQFFGTTASVFQATDAKNYMQARTLLNSTNTISDADFDAFVTQYQAELGTFKSMPKGWMELIAAYQKIKGFNFQPQPGAPIFPIPAEFEKGTGLVLLEFPQGAQMSNKSGSTNPASIPFANLGVFTASGKQIWLVPKNGQSSPPATPPTGQGTNPQPPPAGGNGG